MHCTIHANTLKGFEGLDNLNFMYMLIEWYSAVDLLVVSEENLDAFRKPCIPTDLETALHIVDLTHFLLGELPSIQLIVSLDPRGRNTLWNHTGATLQSPHEQNLLDCLSLLLGEPFQLFVLVKWRVCGT
jgi:hypothetical protein